MDRKTRNQIIVIAVVLVVIAIVGGVGVAILGNNKLKTPAATAVSEAIATTTNSNSSSSSDDGEFGDIWDNTISYNGKTYRYNDDITTMLFMGVDTYEEREENQLIGNGGRADTLLLFILNSSTNTMDILELNRDTYTEIDVYDDNRNFMYSGPMPLSMQYTFGESHTRSCMLMKNKVEEVLYGIPVDYYCSLTIEGMNAVIDAMGGLEVTFDEDMSYVDERYVPGATVLMDSTMSERFFRYRDIEELGSNQTRMNRQSWLMRLVFEEMVRSNALDIEALYVAAGDELTTDMDISVISSIRSYSLGEFIDLPGNYEQGVHDEYHLDEEALQDLLIELFYVEV